MTRPNPILPLARRFARSASTIVLVLSAFGSSVLAQDAQQVHLLLDVGRPLRVEVADRIRVKKAGQPVDGTVVEDIYSYDRIVVPAGTKAHGHIEALPGISGGTRFRHMLAGDFSPPRPAVLRFDALTFADGTEMKIDSAVTSAAEQLVLEEAADGPSGAEAGPAARVRGEIRRFVGGAKAPGKFQRLKYGLLGRLPFHPQYLPPSTVYTATLQSPLDFGTASSLEPAPEGTLPPPGSVLKARLVTPLDSAQTLRGAVVEAVLTRPLLSSDHRLILPEGARFKGEVTFTARARSFHRNGQLRFLFETVQAPPGFVQGALRASLHSVETAQAQRLALDDEGGASITNTKARFAAPALTGLALGLTLSKGLDYNTDGGPPELSGGVAQTNTAGGFIGFGLLGAGLSQVSRSFSVAVGILGVARSGYGAIFGKGRDISFPDGTVISLRLAPSAESSR